MGPLLVTQYMVAAALFMAGLLHLLVWLRHGTGAKISLLFALTALAAGANALSWGGFTRLRRWLPRSPL